MSELSRIDELAERVADLERTNARLFNEQRIEMGRLKEELRSKDQSFGELYDAVAGMKKNIAETLIDVNKVAARADKRWTRLAQALREDDKVVYATQPIPPPMNAATKRFIAGPPKPVVTSPPPLFGFGAKPAASVYARSSYATQE